MISTKNTLISFYYLLEIIKLRKISNNLDNNLKSANNIIKRYNNVIKPYIKLYNEQLEEQDKKSKVMKIKPIPINYEKLAKSLNIDINLIINKPLSAVFGIVSKIYNKRKERKINNNSDYVKPIVKI